LFAKSQRREFVSPIPFPYSHDLSVPRRLARGGVAQLSGPADARLHEILRDGRYPQHRLGSELGENARPIQVVYAFLSPVGGYLADRFSRRYTICGSLFVWSAVTWSTGHVTTYDGLLLTRSLMGISEAFYIPAALALIADYHSGRTRSRAVGLHQMAIYVGVIVGGFSGYVADTPTLSWRFAFDACGMAGILYAVPLALLLRDAPKSGDTDTVVAPGTSVVEA